MTLMGVTAVDDLLGPIPLLTDTLPSLAMTTGVLTYTVTEGDLPGSLVNTAVTTGTPLVGDSVTVAATFTLTLTSQAVLPTDLPGPLTNTVTITATLTATPPTATVTSTATTIPPTATATTAPPSATDTPSPATDTPQPPPPSPSSTLLSLDQPTGLPTNQPIVHTTVQPTVQPTPTRVSLGPLFDADLSLKAGPVEAPLELQIPSLKVNAPMLGVGITAEHSPVGRSAISPGTGGRAPYFG